MGYLDKPLEEMTASEQQAAFYEAKALTLEQAKSYFHKSGVYKGKDVHAWLDSFANEYRKEALKLL